MKNIDNIDICKIFFIVLSLVFTVKIGLSNEIKNITKIGLWSGGTELRGVNIYQRRVYPELDDGLLGDKAVGPVYTVDDFLKLRASGVNFVNISHPGIFTENPPYVVDKEILANLERLLRMIKDADMFAVISFRTGPGRSEFTFFYGEDYESDPDDGWFDKSYYNEKVWTDRKAQQAWVDMWKQTAEYFKDNLVVVGYDLMVEPNSNGVLLDIWKPSEFYPKYKGTTYDWNTIYPDIVDAIRSVDSDTPILIQSLSYGDIPWLKYMTILDDKKIVYTIHHYEPFVYTHQTEDSFKGYPGFYDIDYDGQSDNFNKEWLEKYLAEIRNFKEENNVITSINEFGAVRWAPSVALFIGDNFKLFEKLGVNNAIWMWYPSMWLREPMASMFSDFNFLFGPNPNNFIEIENDFYEVLKKYWGKNRYFPSNIRFISGKKKKGGIRR